MTSVTRPGDTEQIAVFIDFENLAIGAANSLPDQTNPVPYAALELVCRDYGNASIRRAYADWAKQQFGKYQNDLAMNGVDLIQIQRFGIQQKNAADIRMAVDAMETLITHPDIGTYLLVAGDGDYSPLVQRLREFGKHVVGVGTEASASPRLVSVCSEYKYWGTLVAAADPTIRPNVKAAFDIKHGEKLLLQGMQQRVGGDAPGAWLKHKMLSLDPAFDERNYGCRSFKEFLNQMTHVVTVEASDGPGDLRVRLVETVPAQRSEAG
ncbi:NYN domain-containing protein [Amycolatopsis sp. NPDC059027]|uniref:NYN domain-containing protein n=1 Tax=Amycolatopsis sp. NPDC059027 TaxID=3346709 RepID=UPI0036703D69